MASAGPYFPAHRERIDGGGYAPLSLRGQRIVKSESGARRTLASLGWVMRRPIAGRALSQGMQATVGDRVLAIMDRRPSCSGSILPRQEDETPTSQRQTS